VLDWLNRINDWDLTWVGFRSFRPAPEQDMTARVVIALCLVYCPLSAVTAFVVTLLWVRGLAPRFSTQVHYPAELPWIMGACAAVTFVFLQSLLAWVWNRRARRLRSEKQQASMK
jgi:hypothetical protein